ncbi:MAG: hypothetical protein HFJ50_03345 [Clostridia bacterium]|jgi:hypothetical protein|nr:hypothetical protein [Clostridia bacterium]
MEKSTKRQVSEMTESEVLKFIAEYRENSITIKNSVFYKEMQKAKKERQNVYCKFEQELKENVKDEAKLKQVMKCLEEYIAVFNNEHGIYYNHYYVTAIKDMAKLLTGE